MKFHVTVSRNGIHRRFFLSAFASFCFFLCTAQSTVNGSFDPRFKKHTLSNDFISEGVAVGDINNDGKIDIIAGAYWFESPSWTKHELAEPKPFSASTGYSNSFLNYCMDINQDGWMDIIRIGLPGEETVWYENTRNKPGYWPMHWITRNLGNESPLLVDVDADGRPDIIGNDPITKEITWFKSPTVKGDTNWTKYIIDKGDSIPGVHRYTHGLGFADMNGDGRNDIIITKGWWESPADPKQSNWPFHPANLGEDCSQIYTIDIKGKGKKELVSSSAHNYGIWWHEKTDTGWAHHTIFNEFSQTHGLALADINKDGNPDLITGKRYFAHNGKDPGEFQPAVLYWFEYKPGKNPAWIPHLIDDNSGVGLQVCVQDINGDGRLDIIVANKKGVFFFEQVAH